MNPLIVFAIAARTKLEQRLARRLGVEPRALEIAMNDLGKRLQRVFPSARVAIVQDLYAGFRVRTDEYVLLVEVANSGGDDGLSVVKFAPPDRLQRELDNCQSCWPHGLRHDIVLMDLQRRPDDEGEPPDALVYADAEQLIGVDRVLTLEEAMLDAVRLGVPTPQSVADLLFQLYERLGLLLYRHSFDENPTDDGYAFAVADLDAHLAENRRKWNDQSSDAFLTRAAVTTETADTRLRRLLRDPAYTIGWLVDQAARGKPADFLPRLLRGRAHGDLHGRNVLVGRVGDRVLWPAVYDYGDMGPRNLVGWDFVKMETEFKQRAYPGLFTAANFTAGVVRFEEELFKQTERSRASGEWPELAANAQPADRLHWLLLQHRRLAGRHLGQQSRSRLWLMEYYFLLTLYGLNASRFDNLTPIEQKAAYLSAGCAAARFAPLE